MNAPGPGGQCQLVRSTHLALGRKHSPAPPRSPPPRNAPGHTRAPRPRRLSPSLPAPGGPWGASPEARTNAMAPCHPSQRTECPPGPCWPAVPMGRARRSEQAPRPSPAHAPQGIWCPSHAAGRRCSPRGLTLGGAPQAWGGAAARHLRTSWHRPPCPRVMQTGSDAGRNCATGGRLAG